MVKTLLSTGSQFFSNIAASLNYTLVISEAELQAKLSAILPLHMQKYFLTLTVSEPQLELGTELNKLNFGAYIEIKAPGGIKGEGRIHLNGLLHYTPDQGEFFLKDLSIVELEIDQIPLLFISTVKRIMNRVTINILAKRPIYKLNDDKLKHRLAKSVIQSISIVEKQLLVVLGVVK